MFTNEEVDDVRSYFSKTQFDDYARAGGFVDKDIVIPAGRIRYQNTGEYVLPTQKQILESLGMAIKLDQGFLVLDQDYTICKYGDQLTVEQAHILVSQFALKLLLKKKWLINTFH